MDDFAADFEKFAFYYGLEINDFTEVATLNVSETREVYSTAVVSLTPLPGSSSEPIIFVAARGTTNLVNWSDNLDIYQAKAIFPFTDPSLPIDESKTFIQWNNFANFDWDPEDQPGTVCEQNGIRDILECKFKESIFENAPIVFTGHSAGAFTACFHAAASSHEFLTHESILITFASPKTGNKAYNEVISKSVVDKSGGWIRRYIIPNDIVPRISIYNVFHIDESYAPVFTITMANTEEIIDNLENKTIGGINQVLFTIGNLLKADPYYYLGIQEGLYDIELSAFTDYLSGHSACVYREAMLREYWPEGGNVKEGEEDKFIALCRYNNFVDFANSLIKEKSLAYQKNMEILCDVVRNPCNNIWYNDGPTVLKEMICNYKRHSKKTKKDFKKSLKLFADTFWSPNADCIELKPGICNVLNSCNPLKQKPCKHSCCEKKDCKCLEKIKNKSDKHHKKDCKNRHHQVPCKPCKKCKEKQDPPEYQNKKKFGKVKIV